MSRIGKQPVKLPPKVKVVIDGDLVQVEGPKGKTQQRLPGVKFEVKDSAVHVSRPDDSRQSRALHGLSRALVQNMVKGVTIGFERKLELYGVGFKAEIKGKEAISFNVGLSHPALYPLPEGISAEWKETKSGDKQGELTLRGVNKELIGRAASEIRKLRPPEPYKGKGIRYQNERVRRKQGKTGAA